MNKSVPLKSLMSKIIPAYLFNEHNEAYYCWHKARYAGYLDKSLDIFHVDAHSDMGAIKKLPDSIYCKEQNPEQCLARYHEIAYKGMSIANFIIPAVLNGLIRNIYFIYPDWRKFSRRRKKKNVATAFAEGKVFKHDLKIVESEQAKIQIAYPDLQKYTYITTDIDHIPGRRKVILDIDLDYFACTDSITNKMSYQLAITADQYRDRKKFVRENESLQYSGLEIGFKKRGQNHFATVGFENVEDQTHLPTEAEIRKEVDRLIGVLADKKVQPAVITICRSCISGYCPLEYYQMIEAYLLRQLRACFPAISIET